MNCNFKFSIFTVLLVFFIEILGSKGAYVPDEEEVAPAKEDVAELDDKIDLNRNIREDNAEKEKFESDDETDHSVYKGQGGRGLSESGKPDNAVDDFLMHVFNFGYKHTLEALTKFGFEHVDPLKIKDFQLHKGNFVADAVGSTTGVQVKGLEALALNNIHTDLGNMSLHFELGVPSIEIAGNYELNGTILFVFKISGHGGFKFTVNDLHFHLGGDISIADPITVKLDLCKIAIKDLHGKFENIMGSDEVTKKLNDIFEALGTKMFQLFEPIICDKLKSTLGKFVTKELEGVKVPDSIRGYFNKFKDLIGKLRKHKRKKRNEEKVAMIPYLIAENPAKERLLEWDD